MPLSLYDITVPNFTQTLTALAGILEKAEAHCADKGLAPATCIEARLYEDMFPLNVQIVQTLAHSSGALEGVQKGVFSPDRSAAPATFPELKARVAESLAKVARYAPADVNALEGRDMRFEFGTFGMDFTAENFLLSFSLPNFYFHATTAYGILRNNGVPLGKRDYIGPLRLKS